MKARALIFLFLLALAAPALAGDYIIIDKGTGRTVDPVDLEYDMRRELQHELQVQSDIDQTWRHYYESKKKSEQDYKKFKCDLYGGDYCK